MLVFQSSFPPTGQRKEKGTRSRVVGECEGNTLLFSINSLSRTNIEKVFSDGTSLTVISFKGYMDIVSASLSHDHEICHITERIPRDTTFVFHSYLYNILNGTKSKAIESKEPVTAFFLPFKDQDSSYQMIHIIGSKINHLTVHSGKDQIHVTKLRCGLNFYSTLWWNYDSRTQDFYVIHNTENAMILSSFHFTKNKIKNYPIKPITINEDQTLSEELSLSPLSLTHLPYYEFNKRRIFISTFNEKILVIQQFNQLPFEITQHTEERTKLSFMVSIFPENFNDIITVNVSAPDTPISFIRMGECVVVYIPHEFYTFVNFVRGKPMTYTVYSYKDEEKLISNRIQPLWDSKSIIDLSNGAIYEAKVNFYDFFTHLARDTQKSIDSKILSLIAQRSSDSHAISAFLYYIQTHFDTESAISYIEDYFNFCGKSLKDEIESENRDFHTEEEDSNPLFTIKKKIKNAELLSKIQPHLDDMEANYPSQCKYTRTQCFLFTMDDLLKKKESKTIEQAALSALTKMERQDVTVSLLSSAIEEWRTTCNPPLNILFSILRIIQYMTVLFVFPAVDGISSILDKIKKEQYHLIQDLSVNLEHSLSSKYNTPKSTPKIKTPKKETQQLMSQFESVDEQTFSSVEL